MTEGDPLREASKALREAYSGALREPDRTRARIMRSLHERRRRRMARLVVFGPLAAIALGTTAWAQATGQLPRLIVAAEAWLRPVQATAPPAPPPSKERPKKQTKTQRSAPLERAQPLATPGPLEAPDAPSVEPPAAAAPKPGPAVAEPRASREPLTPAAQGPRRARRSPSDAASQDAAARQAPPDAELAIFRQAHRLHFDAGDARAALAAYARYLERYPDGRFVPEARYNTALNLLKLNRPKRARAILERFAGGDYGDYRQREASTLLATPELWQ